MGRNVAITAAVALAIVVVVALVLPVGGDEDNPTVSGPSTKSKPTTTAPAPSKSPPGRRPSNRDAASIQRTVTALVSANERGDGAEVCRLLGQPAAGGGLRALDRCASSAGVDLARLPTSDELSIERIAVSDGRATARLVGSATISLRRAGNGWRVSSIEA